MFVHSHCVHVLIIILKLGRIDVKIEGLNGHLPNLDLVTLVNRMCVKEGVQNTFKNRGAFRSHDPYLEWKYSFQTMMSMIATQSTGVYLAYKQCNKLPSNYDI